MSGNPASAASTPACASARPDPGQGRGRPSAIDASGPRLPAAAQARFSERSFEPPGSRSPPHLLGPVPGPRPLADLGVLGAQHRIRAGTANRHRGGRRRQVVVIAGPGARPGRQVELGHLPGRQPVDMRRIGGQPRSPRARPGSSPGDGHAGRARRGRSGRRYPAVRSGSPKRTARNSRARSPFRQRLVGALREAEVDRSGRPALRTASTAQTPSSAQARSISRVRIVPRSRTDSGSDRVLAALAAGRAGDRHPDTRRAAPAPPASRRSRRRDVRRSSSADHRSQRLQRAPQNALGRGGGARGGSILGMVLSGSDRLRLAPCRGACHPPCPKHQPFPDPVYRETVLAPLFEAPKPTSSRRCRAINQAHLVMLAETGILASPPGGEAGRGAARHRHARRHRADLYRAVRGLLLPRRERIDPAPGPGHRRSAAHRPQPQRHGPHRVQADPAARRPTRCRRRRCRWPARCSIPPGAKPRRRSSPIPTASRHSRRASATTLPRRSMCSSADIARLAAARDGARPLPDGRRGDHHHRLSHRPPPRRGAARLFRPDAELLCVHCRCRLHHRPLFGDQADVPASRSAGAGLPGLGVVRGRPDPRPEQLRADLLDHAAKAQPGADRASAPAGLADRRALRHDGEHDAQHAVHRHERQRGRGAAGRLRRVRQRRPGAGAAGGIRAGPAGARRPGRRQRRRRLRDDHRTGRHAGADRGAVVPAGARDRGPDRAGGDRRRRRVGRRLRRFTDAFAQAQGRSARPRSRGLCRGGVARRLHRPARAVRRPRPAPRLPPHWTPTPRPVRRRQRRRRYAPGRRRPRGSRIRRFGQPSRGGVERMSRRPSGTR